MLSGSIKISNSKRVKLPMKSLLKIQEDKCTICLACVKACPVNAIQLKSDHAFPIIVSERCIACGSCIEACQPEAIKYLSSKEETRKLLESEIPVAAILDPAIAGEFPDITDYRKFVKMIRELGFKKVVEASFGVDLLAAEYKKLFEKHRGKYYVMSNCPVVINYIEKYQPELIPNLAPLVSPAMTTAMVVRKKYGADYNIVYIGPLIAHKSENEQGSSDGKIDSVLTFTELRSMFSENRIDEKQMEYSDFDPPYGYKGALFPIASGIVHAADLNDDLLTGNITTVEGEALMKEALKEFQFDIQKIKSHFNIFYTEYLMGPGTSKRGEKFIRHANVKEYARKRIKNFNIDIWEKEMEEFSTLNFLRVFKNDDKRIPDPPEEKIQEILNELKKDCTSDFGCGMCGFNSCRDFAIAIAKGIAIPEMCNTYTSRNRQDYIQSLKISNEKLAQAEKALRESEKLHKRRKNQQKKHLKIVSAMLQKTSSGIVHT